LLNKKKLQEVVLRGLNGMVELLDDLLLHHDSVYQRVDETRNVLYLVQRVFGLGSILALTLLQFLLGLAENLIIGSEELQKVFDLLVVLGLLDLFCLVNHPAEGVEVFVGNDDRGKEVRELLLRNFVSLKTKSDFSLDNDVFLVGQEVPDFVLVQVNEVVDQLVLQEKVHSQVGHGIHTQ
jgi:hypothetical protein